ncbi:hypothetical protein [uncultured Methanobrevibacter sp.]|uniref:hypothetical protein n=1 Tax=uncultured Methanobrevibacter sp. TaxID=253161 RepID=UPI0015BFDC20|nr:hypothetical protein [uncultured Methanobrevibacter sp.]
MVKIFRIILVVILFIVFFEVGLFSSYTIVTSEAPDVQGLINMQIDEISSFISPDNVNKVLIKDPTPVKIDNKQQVALKIENLSKVDGVNIDSMNMTTYSNPDDDTLNVTIEVLGYASPNSTSSQIVISRDPSYKIVATGNATSGGNVNIDSIKIQSILKLF